MPPNWRRMSTNGSTNQIKQRLEQKTFLLGSLSSRGVLFRVSMMDDDIQTFKTNSIYTQSHQVAISVPFSSFRSKSFGLTFSWVYSHWKTTANLFNAQHLIQCRSSKTEVLNHQSQGYSQATIITNQNAHLRLASSSNNTLALGKPTKFQICPGAILYYLPIWCILMYGSFSSGKSHVTSSQVKLCIPIG